MYSSRTKIIASIAFVFCTQIFVSSCSDSTNFNQFFVSKKQKNSFASLVELAQINYDKGQFSDALKFAEDAEAISPNNEQVGVLLGYIHLALTGMDTFRIAEALLESTKKEKEQSAGLAETSNSTTTLLFSTLVEKMNISSEDLQALGEYSDDEELKAYKNYPIIIPDSASDARASSLGVFEHINKAIEKICPFVDEDVRLKTKDSRHDDDHCTATEVGRDRTVISHFLWAFAHIVESAIFYSVVQYQDAANAQPNIKMRADALQAQQKTLSLSQYAVHATSLADSVTEVYDFADADSQFNAIVNDLTSVSLAFSKIANLPAKFRKSLDKTIAAINDTTGVSGDSENQKKANALKSQLNKNMAANLASKIDQAKADDPAEFAQNKTELCDAYANISGSASLPDSCK